MSKNLPLIMIFGGLIIGAISWAGYQNVNKKSDVEYLQEAIFAQREAQEQQAQAAAALMTKVLPAPKSCAGLQTKFVYDICATEPDDSVSWPDWKLLANSQQQACILETFHQTNAHAFEIRRETYEKNDPDIDRISRFAMDICSASLWTDGIDYEDPDKPISDLITGYYAERAKSRFAPTHDY